jgi:uncharacterized NAD(P)/FAD-binding protein YdhS
MTETTNRVAIIGGGFSGAMVALHLLRQSKSALHITIIEPRQTLGLGLAYSTDCDEHLLNVPAAGMSALADQPDHFYNYAHKHLPEVTPETFVPRKFFGRYVSELIAQAIKPHKQATNDSTVPDIRHNVEHIKAQVKDIEPVDAGYKLHLDDGTTINATLVVLALGNLAGNKPKWLGDFSQQSDCYIHNPWDKQAIAKIKADDDVLIVGTGLTAVDKVLELLQHNHKGQVIAVSRHGLIPQEHLDKPDLSPAQIALAALGSEQNKVTQTLHFVRQSARVQGWRPVVDGLRSVTQEWWHNLDLPQKRLFARYLQTYWDVHRHRMAPTIAQKIHAMQKSGQLRVVAGRLARVSEADNLANVQITTRGTGVVQQYKVKKIINCTGPQAAPTSVNSPLLTSLYERKLVSLHPTRLGINCTEQGQVISADGIVNDSLFAIGPMLKATLLESVAVPEIKHQTKDVAQAICQRL